MKKLLLIAMIGIVAINHGCQCPSNCDRSVQQQPVNMKSDAAARRVIPLTATVADTR